MSEIRDCIIAAAADGQLSPEAEREYLARLDDLTEDGAVRLGRHEAEIMAAGRLQKEIERKLNRRKRMRVKQAIKSDIIRERLMAAPEGTRDKAALAVLDFDPKLNHAGENVSMRHANARGAANAMMLDFIDRFRTRHGGLTSNVEGMEDVVRGLFGEKTTPEARAIAGGIIKARDYLRGRFNFAGGDVVQRKDWGWVQRHDRVRVSAVSEDEWVNFTLDRLDPAKMVDASGQPMSARAMTSAVRASYRRIKTGGLEEMAGVFDPDNLSPIQGRIAHRELVFRDSQAWLQYQQRFGAADMFGSITGEIDKLARDVALVEVLGPYPRATVTAMEAIIDADQGAVALKTTGRASAKASGRIGKHRGLEATFDQVSGAALIPEDAGWARSSQSLRNLVIAARLGSALFVSLSDFATNTLTARMNGVPQVKLLGQLLRQLNPASGADRRMAARMGYISEAWMGSNVAAARFMGEVTGAPSTARIADSVMRLSGLSWWTDAGRNAFRLELTGHMTEQAGKAFDQVEPILLGSMKRHGVTAEDWDLYRSGAVWKDDETGAEFLRPEDTWLGISDMPAELLGPGEREARFQAAQRIGEMIHAESLFAVVQPTARAKALITARLPPGTFAGEMWRNFALFRSFGISFTHLHMSRMMAQRGIASKAQYLAWVTLGMTMGGAIAEQASSVFRGRDPKDMSDPNFWGSAVIRGGAFGPLGDFLYSSTSRHGQNLAEGILGPLLGGTLLQGGRLTIGNVQELIEKGELKDPAGDLLRFTDGLMPGRSLWYARLGWERLINDELTAWIDGPQAEARFRRAERSARRDFDQGFWWRPGDRLPTRLPRVSK